MVRQGVLIALTLASVVVGADQLPREVLDNAIADFRAGRINASISGFDRVIKIAPGVAPELWQRGIALYYAGRFKDCRDQFALHRTVNPDDVENAAWHFLCVARAESAPVARANLLPVGPDARTPMPAIYLMLRGRTGPAEVMASAGGEATAQFYAHLYIGLYLEATGDLMAAREHIALAAAPRFAAVGGYMHDVARVHLIPRAR